MNYWGWKQVPPCWIEIWCDRLHQGDLSFKEKRKIYMDLKELESQIQGVFGILGWISWTELENAHIMRFFHKIQAVPYMINEDNIYFRKTINGVS